MADEPVADELVADADAEVTDLAEAEADDDADVEMDEAEADVPENKDDTGVVDPWRLPATDSQDAASESNGSGHRLLNKIGY